MKATAYVPVGALSLATVFAIFSQNGSKEVAPWLLVGALFFFGLPHGAADAAFLFSNGGNDQRRDWRRILKYLLIALGAGLLLLVMPLLALTLFFVLSAVHFARSEAKMARHDQADGQGPRWWYYSRAVAAVSLPIAADPPAAMEPFDRLFGVLFEEIVSPIPAEIFGSVAVVAGAGALATATAALMLHGGGSVSRRSLVEWMLIIALSLRADPLFAISVYFLFVHAWREAVYVGGVIGARRGEQRTMLSALVRTHVAALPFLLPSWCILWLATFGLGVITIDLLAALILGLLIVVTPPHHWFEHERERDSPWGRSGSTMDEPPGGSGLRGVRRKWRPSQT